MLKNPLKIFVVLIFLFITFSCKPTNKEIISNDYYTPIINPTNSDDNSIYYFGNQKFKNGTVYEDVLYISISCKDKNSIIFYTTDDTPPTPSSLEYVAPIIITDTSVIVRASSYHYSKKSGYVLMGSNEYTFIKLGTPIIRNSPALDRVNDVCMYSTSDMPTIALFPANTGVEIFYTLDESDPTPSSNKYIAPFRLTEAGPITLKAIAAFKRSDDEYAISNPLVVKYDEKYTLLPPTITPNRYDDSPYYLGLGEEIDINLYCETVKDEIEIYYSTEYPAKESSFIKYEGPFKIQGNTIVSARTILEYTNGKQDKSPLVEQEFKVIEKPTVANFFQPSESYLGDVNRLGKGETCIISLSCSSLGSKVYYTIDGSEPTIESTCYTDPIELQANDYCELKAISAITRGFTTIYSDISITKFEETISPVPPTITPHSISGGIYYHSYNQNFNASLSHEQSFVKLFYTLDGSDPTEESNEYTGEAISAPSGYNQHTIKVKGFRHYKNGEVGETEIGIANFAWLEKPRSNIQGDIEQPYRYECGGSVNVKASKTLTLGELYYTIDGSTPTPKSTKYEGSINVSGYGFTIIKIANIIKRNNDYYDISEIQTIILEEKINVLPPNILPEPVENDNKFYYPLNGSVNATITSNYERYKVYYTLDGTEPTNKSNIYNQNTGINITGTGITTLKAITAFIHENGDEEYSHYAEAFFQEKIDGSTLTLNLTVQNDCQEYPQISISPSNEYSEFCQNASVTISANNFEIVNPKYFCYYNSDSQNIINLTSDTINIDSTKIVEGENKNSLDFKAYLTADNIEGKAYSNTIEIHQLTLSYLEPTFSDTRTEPFDVSMSFEIENPQENGNSTIYYSLNNEIYSIYPIANQINLDRTTTVNAFTKDTKYFSPIANKKYEKFNIGSGRKLSTNTVCYSDLKYGTYDNHGAQEFNLYLPDYAENITQSKPCVIYVHGGSWTSGNQSEYARYFEDGSQKYADSYCQIWGLPVISIDYRHIGESNKKLRAYAKAKAVGITVKSVAEDVGYYCFGDNGTRIWDCAKDIESVMKFIYKYKNTLKIDPQFCIFDGYSAGANLEMLYALNNEYEKPIPVKALISRCGPADMSNNEYIRFFSNQLTRGTYEDDVEVYLGISDWSQTFTVTIEMLPTNPDTGDGEECNGENFIVGMIKSATGLNCSFSQIQELSSRGLFNANTPTEVKRISPAAWVSSCTSLPYMVLAYGDVVNLHVGARNYAPVGSNDFGSEVSLDGDPLAPRLAGEVLVKKLNDRIVQDGGTSLISLDGSGNINKNQGNWCYYRGDITKGQKFAFIGSSVGGHDIASKDRDETFSKHWTTAELNALKESINYALGTVCGLTKR